MKKRTIFKSILILIPLLLSMGCRGETKMKTIYLSGEEKQSSNDYQQIYNVGGLEFAVTKSSLSENMYSTYTGFMEEEKKIFMMQISDEQIDFIKMDYRNRFYETYASMNIEEEQMLLEDGQRLQGTAANTYSISPDGRYFAFVKSQEGSASLVVKDLFTDEYQTVYDGRNAYFSDFYGMETHYDIFCKWSSNGEKLLFWEIPVYETIMMMCDYLSIYHEFLMAGMNIASEEFEEFNEEVFMVQEFMGQNTLGTVFITDFTDGSSQNTRQLYEETDYEFVLNGYGGNYVLDVSYDGRNTYLQWFYYAYDYNSKELDAESYTYIERYLNVNIKNVENGDISYYYPSLSDYEYGAASYYSINSGEILELTGRNSLHIMNSLRSISVIEGVETESYIEDDNLTSCKKFIVFNEDTSIITLEDNTDSTDVVLYSYENGQLSDSRVLYKGTKSNAYIYDMKLSPDESCLMLIGLSSQPLGNISGGEIIIIEF